MKERTKAYMAGLMDAEGCFTLIKSKRPWGVNYQDRMSLVNTFLPLRKWVIKHFGGSARIRIQRIGTRPRFDWKPTSHKHASSFISCIHPYLRIKQREAGILKEFYALAGEHSPDKRELLTVRIWELKNRDSVTTDMSRFEKDNLENAYLAGFFDGEGCIAGDESHSLRLFLTNTDYNSLVRVHQAYGGTIRKLKRRKNWSQCWTWELGQQCQIEKVLLKILPYLIVKRDQGKVALEITRLWHNRNCDLRKRLFTRLSLLKHDTV